MIPIEERDECTTAETCPGAANLTNVTRDMRAIAAIALEKSKKSGGADHAL
jgi:hypothetical protein